GVDVGGEEVERGLLRKPKQRAEDDLPPVPTDNLPYGPRLDAPFGHQRLEHRRLENAEPDVQADTDQDDADQEGNPPAPGQERRTGEVLGDQGHDRGQEETHRNPELGPTAQEALPLLASPLHRHEHRAAPLPAHADALAEPQRGPEDRRPNADPGV